MIILIDNYDSFTYNLVHALGALGADTTVLRNDAVTVDVVAGKKPEAIVISPGPCTPEKAGISVELVRRLSGQVPILGVCLGHQAIGVAFGATVSRAGSIMHGKTSLISHAGQGLYRGLKNPFVAGRYHSLAVVRTSLPPELIVEATADDGEIMGFRHCRHPTYGVQFHPESILTPSGKRLLKNFLDLVRNPKGAAS
ncbi:MAG: aminodeoxychorismate/anthranilate synthase component II [Verrucomicrobia bacterium]|nr:aminodeoxychorismate/anthranilate synthase component II [Verrucomicrobiota bacterium]MCG2680841.1 aminodeoxychorismate/anthranilate synthase component II [Kiritimatiellia bacterium]MBU4246851.1 aminodeoxychorismate/anthranilate synthase component II [Verrucomicrobiota bacterium]MBU4290403.1 aminodeoxychorismate/anthranilate synthase component II [Verrucomicrobiota bacterium]MBU4430254.1 aminodeoxychorismate/anthranilate synthase component II [Verrucomicrobiota bacterium]